MTFRHDWSIRHKGSLFAWGRAHYCGVIGDVSLTLKILVSWSSNMLDANTCLSMRNRREHLPRVRPASRSMFQPSIPMLYPCHTELGVPFAQLQKHKSFVYDWKKWWRGSVMTILTSLGTIACFLGH